ncbi:unnamed protein product, partial [Menidia menidia]
MLIVQLFECQWPPVCFGPRFKWKPLPWTLCFVLSQLQYSMCTLDVSLPFDLQVKFLVCHIPALMLFSEYPNSLGHLIMVMFEYLLPVLLQKNKKKMNSEFQKHH